MHRLQQHNRTRRFIVEASNRPERESTTTVSNLLYLAALSAGLQTRSGFLCASAWRTSRSPGPGSRPGRAGRVAGSRAEAALHERGTSSTTISLGLLTAAHSTR